MAGVSEPNEATRRRRDEIVALYRELGPELTRWARLLVGDAQAARCVREAFVRLYSGADIVLIDDPVHEARIALFSVARSYRTSTRKRDRRQPDPNVPPAIAALQQLTARQRECVVLRHYGGMSEGQTARIIGISIGSVRTHYRCPPPGRCGKRTANHRALNLLVVSFRACRSTSTPRTRVCKN